jgi:hypothetical protein
MQTVLNFLFRRKKNLWDLSIEQRLLLGSLNPYRGLLA